MNKDALRKKRARAEWRFKAYGIFGLGLATAALFGLLVIIIGKGSMALSKTEIGLTVSVTQTKSTNLENLVWRTVLHDNLATTIPEAAGAEKKHKLLMLLSSDADIELRFLVKKDPALINSGNTVWFTASDGVDRYTRSNPKTRDNDTAIQLNDEQKGWLASLQKQNRVRVVFNKGFFTHGDSRNPEQAGFLSSMMGSLLTLVICLGVAFPLGVLAAIYLEEFAPTNKFTDAIEVNINNLAAVPSIVFGLLGLAIYLNVFGLPRSAPLVGGLTLALMILPTIIITTRAAIKSVPDSIRNAARALGASPIQVVFDHVVPLSVPGIMTGTILGLARAIGETAPLLLIGMVAFVADVPKSFADPAAAMPVQIYLWAASPQLSFVEKTAAGIMVLLAVLLLMNAVAIIIRRKFEHHW